jgi:hypothetical protein
MRYLSRKALLAAAVLLLATSTTTVSCFPSGGSWPLTKDAFTYRNGEWYDSWGYDRNYYAGEDGFMPNLVYETIGANKELAYSIGENFMTSYSSDVQRAVAILQYVQRWTEYGYDEDNVFMGGVAQPEWAWNADETAHMFNVNTGTVAIGDCEDMAFLCGTIYLGAGYDVALVDAPGHAALLIWLPDYPNANYYWDIGDGRGAGWIWVEATGEQNPLGWTPPDFNDGDWTPYAFSSVSSLISSVNYSPSEPGSEDDVTVTVTVSTGSSISNVVLVYSIDGGTDRTLSMSRVGTYYKATIPKQSLGTDVEFQVSVTDTDGNTTESGMFSYTVGGGGTQIEIPGFPIESIIAGLVIGLLILYQLSRKKNTLPIPGR